MTDPSYYKNAINNLSNHKESILLPLMQFSPKLILTGSTVLYMIGAMTREPNDFDIALCEPLTEDELNHIKDFFNLKIRHENELYDSGNGERRVLWDASKQLAEQEIIPLLSSDENALYVKIDIFNKHYFEEKDIYYLDYTINGEIYQIRVLHPSIAISHKSKYAFDPRVGSTTSFKHMNDLKDLIINAQKYFQSAKRFFRK